MIKQTSEGLKILINANGQESIFINSDRLDDCINYMYNNNINYIIINSFQDYKALDIDFLYDLVDLIQGISILDTHYNLEVVNKLSKLKYLGIPDNGKNVIDLVNFPQLEICGIPFSERFIGLEFCHRLLSLTLTNYTAKTKNLLALPSLAQLEHLSLIMPDIVGMDGIEQFANLKKLEIIKAVKLKSISALKTLSDSLKELQIEQCKKIKDFESIHQLKNIEKIILSESGEIESLSFIKGLSKLQFFSFWGTTVMDGNIKFCEGLQYVGFDDKKHYTHKFQDFAK